MKTTEYTVKEMKTLLEQMSGMYDLARVVDPIECRILNCGDDGKLSMSDRCYNIWQSSQKCVNCTSAMACETGCHQEKSEHFDENVYHIQSNPVKLKLPDGGAYDAVVELVSVNKENKTNVAGTNDRAAENVGDRAYRYKAVHDTLTRVLNSGAFYEAVRGRIVSEPDKAWVFIAANIREFRLVNALFSVLKGNEILVRTAGRLKGIAERRNGICGRIGGDVFALFIPASEYREEDLTEAAKALTGAFSSGLFTFCIQFGVYRIDDSTIPVSVMCDRSNAALHTLRSDKSRTVVYFDDSMMRKSLFDQEVVSGFESALENGEFKMYLQPLADQDGRIFGAEALVRWVRPDGTVIMPGDFIETLEGAGLIHKLDMYMWEQAVRQLATWKGTDKADLTISVNMSAKDFYNIDINKVLTEMIAKYGVDSRRLRLEITETAMLEDTKEGDSIVSMLRDAGFVVEIDDFGKGYSSISMLKDIHADILKIDMSLLHEIEIKERSRVILESVINLADSLDMDVITEGVETEEQLKSLTRMGCRHFQGYYFSKPVTVTEFEQRLS